MLITNVAMSLHPASLIEPHADIFVVPDRLRVVLRENLRNSPSIQVVRTAPPAGSGAANAYRNSEAHKVAGGGIIFMHGSMPFHEQEARTASYIRTGPHRV